MNRLTSEELQAIVERLREAIIEAITDISEKVLKELEGKE